MSFFTSSLPRSEMGSTDPNHDPFATDKESLVGYSSRRPPNKDVQVHSLPCTVKHDGPASVATFFQQKETEDGVSEAPFRGRLLKGIKVPVPEGTVGIIAKEGPLPPEVAEKHPSAGARFWSVESEFKEVTLWKHDDVPPPDHAIYGLNEWLEVSKAIHED